MAEAATPGVPPSPPLFGSMQGNDRLWHFAFNRLAAVNEQLVTGREDVYFGFQFAKAARALPGDAVQYYIETLAAGPDALHGSFAACARSLKMRTKATLAMSMGGVDKAPPALAGGALVCGLAWWWSV